MEALIDKKQTLSVPNKHQHQKLACIPDSMVFYLFIFFYRNLIYEMKK